MYLVKTPFFLRWLYPGLIWNKSRQSKLIYLTFDDGPIPVVTPFVLKTLKRFDAKATFFCIGDNIRKHPEIFEAVLADGHRVGNHTFNHLRGWDTEDTVYLDNIRRCQELVRSDLFRPPYGRMKRSQMRKLSAISDQLSAVNGSRNELSAISHQPSAIIMWDVLSGDFDVKLSPGKCLSNVLKHTENGSIVVFHDSLKAFDRLEYTLPRALEAWTKAGFSFAVL